MLREFVVDSLWFFVVFGCIAVLLPDDVIKTPTKSPALARLIALWKIAAVAGALYLLT